MRKTITSTHGSETALTVDDFGPMVGVDANYVNDPSKDPAYVLGNLRPSEARRLALALLAAALRAEETAAEQGIDPNTDDL